MSGAGLGSAAGTALGVALAPETGGLSMLIPAVAGAAGGALGGSLTGSKNPLMDALMGGVGGGLTGGLSGGADAAGFFGDAGAAGAGSDAALEGATSDAASLTPGWADAAASSAPKGVLTNALGLGANQANSGIGSYLASKDPLSLALAGTTGLSALQALMPHKQVNVGQNRADVFAGSGMNGTLPQYNVVNTGTPYTGDWNTYGFKPQTPMYNATLVRQYAKGGEVKGYAAGGMPQMPQQGAPATPTPNIPVNPLTIAAAHHIGQVIGQKLRSPLRTPLGQVHGKGGGQDDLVPAKLAQGEYIVPSEAVSQLGDGSTNQGAKKLDGMVKHIRAHKTSKGSGFPPKARNPLSYLSKKAKV